MRGPIAVRERSVKREIDCLYMGDFVFLFGQIGGQIAKSKYMGCDVKDR